MSAFMDIYESLNSILVTLFNDIMNIEEKALITDEYDRTPGTFIHLERPEFFLPFRQSQFPLLGSLDRKSTRLNSSH